MRFSQRVVLTEIMNSVVRQHRDVLVLRDNDAATHEGTSSLSSRREVEWWDAVHSGLASLEQLWEHQAATRRFTSNRTRRRVIKRAMSTLANEHMEIVTGAGSNVTTDKSHLVAAYRFLKHQLEELNSTKSDDAQVEALKADWILGLDGV